MKAPVLSRIKVMAGLNIAERRLPQDGRLRLAVREHETDLRVASVHPSSPLLGAVVTDAQTAAFARTLGSLVEGGVPLPTALSIAQRSVANRHMAVAIARVAAGLKEGGGLSGPLAASGVFRR